MPKPPKQPESFETVVDGIAELSAQAAIMRALSDTPDIPSSERTFDAREAQAIAINAVRRAFTISSLDRVTMRKEYENFYNDPLRVAIREGLAAGKSRAEILAEHRAATPSIFEDLEEVQGVSVESVLCADLADLEGVLLEASSDLSMFANLKAEVTPEGGL